MILMYFEQFPLSMLEPEFPRGEEFYKNRPEFLQMRELLIESIQREGLKYPLCARNKLDDGKTYHVGLGMQRLEALRDMGATFCKVIIANKPTQNHIPVGRVVSNPNELEEIFGCKLRSFVLKPNCFEAQPVESPKEWDPIRLVKR